MGSLERRLGVFFVSNALSDALSIAGFERGDADAGIVVFPAAVFNEALRQGHAGVLAYAEGGLVFRYPFLTQAPRLENSAYLLLDQAARNRIDADTDLASCRASLKGRGTEFLLLEQAAPRAKSPRCAQVRVHPPANIQGARFEKSPLRPSAVTPSDPPRHAANR